jgi:hypothetical protein
MRGNSYPRLAELDPPRTMKPTKLLLLRLDRAPDFTSESRERVISL